MILTLTQYNNLGKYYYYSQPTNEKLGFYNKVENLSFQMYLFMTDSMKIIKNFYHLY